jgi:hypothetical protein
LIIFYRGKYLKWGKWRNRNGEHSKMRSFTICKCFWIFAAYYIWTVNRRLQSSGSDTMQSWKWRPTFGGICFLCVKGWPWRWRQYISLKNWYPFSGLLDVTKQTITIVQYLYSSHKFWLD